MTDHLQTAIAAVRLYAETHPRPVHVTQKQAAEMIGKSLPTVGKMVRAGVLRLNKAGMIPIAEVDRVIGV